MGGGGAGGEGALFGYHPGDGVRFHFEDTLMVNNQQLKGGVGCVVCSVRCGVCGVRCGV